MTLDRRPDETARLRRLILRSKVLDREDEGWRQPPVPPRLLPFGRTLKLGSDWKWRHLNCSAGDDRFLLLGRVNMRKGNYQAWLLHLDGAESRLLARVEDHAGHAGLHVHAHCGSELPEFGVTSIQAPVRRPRADSRPTVQGATLDMFWSEARGMFNIRPQPLPDNQLMLSL
jgi:hypothetical protein